MTGNSGSLHIKKGTYYAVFYVKDDNNKNKPVWRSTKIKANPGNKRKAESIMWGIIEDYYSRKDEKTPPVLQVIDNVPETESEPENRILFTDWIENWLEMKRKLVDRKKLELGSWESYKIYVDLHVLPYFQNLGLYLDEVNKNHIQGYYDTKEEAGLSANSIIKHNVVIRGALKYARSEGLISENPADLAQLPQKVKFRGSHYSVAEAGRLLDAIVDEPIRPVIVLALHLGLRRSEVVGLKWDCVDLDRGTMEIRNTVVRVKTLVEKERTKNKSSHRTMPLTQDIVDMLEEMARKQRINRATLRDGYYNSSYICVWPGGRPFMPDYISRKFPEILVKKWSA